MEEQELEREEEVETASQEVEEQDAVGDQDLIAPEEKEPVDELAALRQELAEVQARQAEYLDGWQRARAELANARKRFQREQEQAYDNARAALLVRLLPILDDFQRAFGSLPEDLSGQAWIDGVRLIEQKFHQVLQQEGVTAMEAEGQQFDPFLHQAITHESSDTVPAGHIISVLQTGYYIGDQVLRPSMVRVSSGPEGQAEDEGQADAETVA